MKKRLHEFLLFLSVIILGLIFGATISLFFHALVSDSAFFFVFGWWMFTVFVLPFSIVVFSVSILLIHSIKDLRILFILSILAQLLSIELIELFPDRIRYIYLYPLIFFGITTLNYIWYLFKKYTQKNIYWFCAISIVLISSFYIFIYINSPITAYDICKQITINQHEEKLLKILKDNDISEKRRHYLERSYSREKNRYFIESSIYCSVSVNDEGIITDIHVWQDSI